MKMWRKVGHSLNRGKIMNEDKRIKVLEMIIADMRKDVEHFDGRPFNGRTVAVYFGNQGAAISALAGIMKLIIKQLNEGKANEKVNDQS